MIESFILGLMIIMLARNQSVFASRMHMIDHDMILYRAMPSYGAMMLNPCHWSRWTGKQWQEWLSKESHHA